MSRTAPNSHNRLVLDQMQGQAGKVRVVHVWSSLHGLDKSVMGAAVRRKELWWGCCSVGEVEQVALKSSRGDRSDEFHTRAW